MKYWLDQYFKPDEVLTFEAYNLDDMEGLYESGMLTSKNEKEAKKQ